MAEKEVQSDFKIANIILYFIIGLVIIILIVGFVRSVFNKSADKETLKKIDENIVLVEYTYAGKSMEGVYFESTASGSGVLFYGDNEKYNILTNRHIVDCGYWDFGDRCWEKLWEKIEITTRDGKLHNVTKIGYSPHGLNIVQLEISKEEGDNYSTIEYTDNPIQGEYVLAAGYPVYSDNTLKLSINKGYVTGFTPHLTEDGFLFNGIDSDAYNNFHSTGGGLFDEYGNLLGITMWSNEYSAYAMDYYTLSNLLDGFSYCEEGYYFKADTCIKRCKKGEMRSIIDSLCYKEVNTLCEDSSYYCEEGYFCLNNECISCPENTYLFEDGQCYYKSDKEIDYN